MNFQPFWSLFRVYTTNRIIVGRNSSLICACTRSLASSSPIDLDRTSDGEDTLSENDVVNPNFINRNPRNLEQLGLARKRKGWRFNFPSRKFYHRLIFEADSKGTTARVVHTSGDTVISATTNEYAIAKHLYALNDVSAAVNIGRVISQRCLESGITSMVFYTPWDADKSEKLTAFQDALIAGGLELKEPEEVEAHYEPGIDYDNEEEMDKLKARQQRIKALGETHRLALITRKNIYGKRNKRRLPQPYKF